MAAKNWTNCCEIIVSLMVENRHPEPLFDELISTWMGESIHSEYIVSYKYFNVLGMC